MELELHLAELYLRGNCYFTCSGLHNKISGVVCSTPFVAFLSFGTVYIYIFYFSCLFVAAKTGS